MHAVRLHIKSIYNKVCNGIECAHVYALHTKNRVRSWRCIPQVLERGVPARGLTLYEHGCAVEHHETPSGVTEPGVFARVALRLSAPALRFKGDGDLLGGAGGDAVGGSGSDSQRGRAGKRDAGCGVGGRVRLSGHDYPLNSAGGGRCGILELTT